jgi:hypothetical protein
MSIQGRGSAYDVMTATAHAGGAANKGAYGEVVTTCRKFRQNDGEDAQEVRLWMVRT